MLTTKRTYRGVVRNGAIVLEPPAVLPEGAEVEIIELNPPPVPDWEVAQRYIGAVRSADEPVDVSERVDEHLAEMYATNKVSDKDA